MLDTRVVLIISLVIGWVLDLIFRDPECQMHPIVLLGRSISFFERVLNRGNYLLFKGAMMAISIISIFGLTTMAFSYGLEHTNEYIQIIIYAIIIFFMISGSTLIYEVKMVFYACNQSLERGREQLSRIVGRDTSSLQITEIKRAALETLSENLSDGVIAPLFWFMIFGLPGIVVYKVINTMDSMVGYKSDRYILFGRFAAKLDDVVNYIPARLTAILILLSYNRLNLIPFVLKYGKSHSSPNSGYPESALAAVLNCRFGGPSTYFGKVVDKPYIGYNNRDFNDLDLRKSIYINRVSEIIMVFIVSLVIFLIK